MHEDACVRTCQPDYIWSEKLKDFSIADVARALLEFWERLDLCLHGMFLMGTFATIPENTVAALELSGQGIGSWLTLSRVRSEYH
ncbi:hypothetical protein TNCV_4676631 [Trichonephila clavipes]|nr:hypothetical protein TNCV_4676631 [Trichonephila clavipes]